jgi:uncharacterized protein (TIGR02246 family)
MKSLLLLPALTVISSLAAGPAMAQPANQKTKVCPVVTSRDIESQFSRFSAAWATLDPGVVTGLFTAEPVLLATVSNTPRTTPASVRDYFVSFLKNKPVGKIDSSTIEIDCNTASRVGTWTVTVTDPATGKARDVRTRYSFIYRFEGNDWKIDHVHSSAMPEPTSAGQ